MEKFEKDPYPGLTSRHPHSVSLEGGKKGRRRPVGDPAVVQPGEESTLGRDERQGCLGDEMDRIRQLVPLEMKEKEVLRWSPEFLAYASRRK